MKRTIQERRERTRKANHAKYKARNQALADLKEFGVRFDFLRPCPSNFDPSINWRKSRTTWNYMTRSVMAMYTRTVGPGLSERVIELSTGDYYYLRTFKNKENE